MPNRFITKDPRNIVIVALIALVALIAIYAIFLRTRATQSTAVSSDAAKETEPL